MLNACCCSDGGTNHFFSRNFWLIFTDHLIPRGRESYCKQIFATRIKTKLMATFYIILEMIASLCKKIRSLLSCYAQLSSIFPT